MKLGTKIVTATVAALITGSVYAGEAISRPVAVPELDGGIAVLALGLTAVIIAVIKEKRRG